MKKYKKLILIFILFVSTIYANNNTYKYLGNEKIRFGQDGHSLNSFSILEDSVDNRGLLKQPFYYDTDTNKWYKLSYSNYTMDMSIGVGGDDSDEWNNNGVIINSPILKEQQINISDDKQILESIGKIDILLDEKTITIEITSTYTLLSDNSYVKMSTKIKNLSSELITNLRVWYGIKDDFIHNADLNYKFRGNFENKIFTKVEMAELRAKVLKVYDPESKDSLFFFSSNSKADMIIANTYSNKNLGESLSQTALSVVDTDPRTKIEYKSDGAYGMYIKLNDIALNESVSFDSYYGAGEDDELDNIIEDIIDDEDDETEDKYIDNDKGIKYCDANPTMCIDDNFQTIEEIATENHISILQKDILIALENNDMSSVKKLYKIYSQLNYHKGSNRTSPLHVEIKKSAKRLDIKAIEKLINNGANLNFQDKNGRTAIHLLITKKGIEYDNIIQLLINSGADTTIEDFKTNSEALSYAMIKKRPNKFNLLVDNGVNIDYRMNGKNIVYKTLKKNSIKKMVQFLLDAGANIDNIDGENRHLVHYLAQKYDTKTIDILLKNNIDISATDSCGQNAINYVYMGSGTKLNTKMIEYLEAKDLTEGVFCDGKSKYHMHAQYGHIRTLEEAIKNEELTNFEIVDDNGRTMLHLAALWGKQKIISLLLEKGANINAVDNNGDTALTLSLKNSNSKNALNALKILFKIKDLNLNIINNENQNILHIMAGANKSREYINSLNKKELANVHNLANGIKTLQRLQPQIFETLVNAKDIYGKTPLIYTLITDNSKATNNLIKLGANVDIITGSGKNPLHYAYLYSRDYKSIKYLQKAGLSNFQKTEDDWYWAKSNNFDKEFLKENLDWTSIDSSGNYAIHYLALNGHKARKDIVKMITEYGIDVNIQSQFTGKTALHYLAKYSTSKSAIKYLIEKNEADYNIMDNMGRKPIFYAFLNDKLVFEYLLELE
jgi:ankyrin repeat protein